MLDLLGQHDWRLKQFFKDPRLRAMFTFQVPLCAVWHVAVWSAPVRRAAGSGLSAPQVAVCCRQVGAGCPHTPAVLPLLPIRADADLC